MFFCDFSAEALGSKHPHSKIYTVASFSRVFLSIYLLPVERFRWNSNEPEKATTFRCRLMKFKTLKTRKFSISLNECAKNVENKSRENKNTPNVPRSSFLCFLFQAFPLDDFITCYRTGIDSDISDTSYRGDGTSNQRFHLK